MAEYRASPISPIRTTSHTQKEMINFHSVFGVYGFVVTGPPLIAAGLLSLDESWYSRTQAVEIECIKAPGPYKVFRLPTNTYSFPSHEH